MATIVPFHRRRRPTRKCANSECRSRSSNNKSLKSQQNINAANVFQVLAFENPYGLKVLESLGRKMLRETRSASRR